MTKLSILGSGIFRPYNMKIKIQKLIVFKLFLGVKQDCNLFSSPYCTAHWQCLEYFTILPFYTNLPFT